MTRDRPHERAARRAEPAAADGAGRGAADAATRARARRDRVAARAAVRGGHGAADRRARPARRRRAAAATRRSRSSKRRCRPSCARAARAGPLPRRAAPGRCCWPAATARSSRRGPRAAARRPSRPLVWTAQAALVAFAIACLVVQRGLVFGFSETREPITQQYFTNATLVASALGAVAIVAATRSERVRARAGRWARDTPARRVGWTLAAALLIAVWLLHAFNTEATVFNETPPGRLPPAVHARRNVRGAERPHAARRLRRAVRLAVALSGRRRSCALLGTSVGVFTASCASISGARAARDVRRAAARRAQLADRARCCSRRSSRRASSCCAARSRTATRSRRSSPTTRCASPGRGCSRG